MTKKSHDKKGVFPGVGEPRKIEPTPIQPSSPPSKPEEDPQQQIEAIPDPYKNPDKQKLVNSLMRKLPERFAFLIRQRRGFEQIRFISSGKNINPSNKYIVIGSSIEKTQIKKHKTKSRKRKQKKGS